MEASAALISVLKVVNPGHYIVKEIENDGESQRLDNFINLERIIQERFTLYDIQPMFLEYPAKGEILIVKEESDGCWYRARVESVIETSKGTRISVYLVDYGKLATVRKEWLRKIPPEMLKVPFQAVEFLLYGLQPLTLDLDMEDPDLRAHYCVSQTWDTAAMEYVTDLLTVCFSVKARLFVVDVSGTQHGEIFVSDGTEDVSLNNQLIKQRFATFSKHSVKKIVPFSKQQDTLQCNETVGTASEESEKKGLGCDLTLKELVQQQQEKRQGVIAEILELRKQHSEESHIPENSDELLKCSIGRGFVPISLSSSKSCKSNSLVGAQDCGGSGLPTADVLSRGPVSCRSQTEASDSDGISQNVSLNAVTRNAASTDVQKSQLSSKVVDETKSSYVRSNVIAETLTDNSEVFSQQPERLRKSKIGDELKLSLKGGNVSVSAANKKLEANALPGSHKNVTFESSDAIKPPLVKIDRKEQVTVVRDSHHRGSLRNFNSVNELVSERGNIFPESYEKEKVAESPISRLEEVLRKKMKSKSLSGTCILSQGNENGEDKLLPELQKSENMRSPTIEELTLSPERRVSTDSGKPEIEALKRFNVTEETKSFSEKTLNFVTVSDSDERRALLKLPACEESNSEPEKAMPTLVRSESKEEEDKRLLNVQLKESALGLLSVLERTALSSSDLKLKVELLKLLGKIEVTLPCEKPEESTSNSKSTASNSEQTLTSSPPNELLLKLLSKKHSQSSASYSSKSLQAGSAKSSLDSSSSVNDSCKIPEAVFNGSSSVSPRSELLKILTSKTTDSQRVCLHSKDVCDTSSRTAPELTGSENIFTRVYSGLETKISEADKDLKNNGSSSSCALNVCDDTLKDEKHLQAENDNPLLITHTPQSKTVSATSTTSSLNSPLAKLLSEKRRSQNENLSTEHQVQVNLSETPSHLSAKKEIKLTERNANVLVTRTYTKENRERLSESVSKEVERTLPLVHSPKKASPTVAQNLLKSLRKLSKSAGDREDKKDIVCTRLAVNIETPVRHRQSNEEWADSDLDATLNSSFRTDSAETYSDQLNTIFENFCQMSGKDIFKTDMEFLQDYMQRSNILKALTRGRGAPNPIFQKEHVPFVSSVHKRLEELDFARPTVVQAYVWPAVCSGRSAVMVSPPHSGKSLACILPLISSILEGVNYEDLPPGSGPLVLMLSSSWRGCQLLYNQCMLLMPRDKKLRINVIYGGGCEKSKQTSLINGCDILIATPGCFLRILVEGYRKFTNLDRCCHLVLDDGEILTDIFTEEVKRIINEYALSMKTRQRYSVPNQIILCCQHWTKGVESFVSLIMNEPLVYITSLLEGAVYSQIPIFCHPCLTSTRNQTLISIIENSSKKRKIVVCTCSVETASFVKNLLQNSSIYAFFAHENLPHFKLQEVKDQWHSSKLLAVLIVTDPVLYQIPVTDADVLIHYDLPEFSKGRFGHRFMYVFNSMQPVAVVPKDESPVQNKANCHLLVTEECQRQATDIVKLLLRSRSQVPRLLVVQMKTYKMTKPLCRQMKAFGVCSRETWCPNRHFIIADCERPRVLLPNAEFKVFVTYVVDATCYYVRLLEAYDPETKVAVGLNDGYLRISFNMAKHFVRKESRVTFHNPQPGDVCAFESKRGAFSRVVVEELEGKKENSTTSRCRVRYLDEGSEEWVHPCKLLRLPEDLSEEEPQAFEVFLSKLKPVDCDTEWTIQANTYVNGLIRGKEMTTKVALCLGRTLWLSSLVSREHLASVSAVVNTLSVGSKLVKNGFALKNPKHIDLLRTACKEKIVFPDCPKLQPPATKESLPTPETKTAKRCMGRNLELSGNGPFTVFVSAVYTPELFFVQLCPINQSLTSLSEEITRLVETKRLEPVSDVSVGLLCIAPFDDVYKWHRAKVTSVNRDGKNETYGLFFLDFGDEGNAAQGDLYHMTEELLLLPFEAIECSLDGIVPLHGGWSTTVCDQFLGLTRDNENYFHEIALKVVRESGAGLAGNRHYVVHLYLNDESIVEKLVIAGLCQIDIVAQTHSVCNGRESAEERSSVSESDIENQACEAALFFKLLVANSANRPASTAQDISSDEEFLEKDRHKAALKDSRQMSDDRFSVNVACSDLPRKQTKPSLIARDGSLIKQFPPLTWWQTKKAIFIAIEVQCKEYTIDYSSDKLSFFTSSNTECYAMDIQLYASVDHEKAFGNAHSRSVDVSLKKMVKGVWPRLLSDKVKHPLVKYDFDHLCSSSDSETSGKEQERYVPSCILPYDPEDERSDENDSEDDDIVGRVLPETEDPYNLFT